LIAQFYCAKQTLREMRNFDKISKISIACHSGEIMTQTARIRAAIWPQKGSIPAFKKTEGPINVLQKRH